MPKIYRTIYLITTILIIDIMLSACSKNEENIAAPSIIIYTDNMYRNVLAEDDTVPLKSYSYLKIFIEAKSTVPMSQMIVGLKCLSNQYANDEIGIYTVTPPPKTFNYYYPEDFDLNKITEISRMQLYVTCKNSYGATNTLWRKFYVKP